MSGVPARSPAQIRPFGGSVEGLGGQPAWLGVVVAVIARHAAVLKGICLFFFFRPASHLPVGVFLCMQQL